MRSVQNLTSSFMQNNNYYQKGNNWVDNVFSRFISHYKKSPTKEMYQNKKSQWFKEFGFVNIQAAIEAAAICIQQYPTMPTAGQFKEKLRLVLSSKEAREKNMKRVMPSYPDKLVALGAEICALNKQKNPELTWDDITMLFGEQKDNTKKSNPEKSEIQILEILRNELLSSFKDRKGIPATHA